MLFGILKFLLIVLVGAVILFIGFVFLILACMVGVQLGASKTLDMLEELKNTMSKKNNILKNRLN